MLSGLLKCGTCGGPMSVVGGTVRGGTRLVNYGCSTQHAKGTSACPNTKSISERKARQSVIKFAMKYFQSEDFRQHVEAGRRRAHEAEERTLRANDGLVAAEAKVRAQQARVDRLVEAITNLGVSESLASRLKTEEPKLVEMRGKLAALAGRSRPKKLPAVNVEALIADLRSLRSLNEKDPAAARESLLRVVESVVLKPVGENYAATLTFRSTTAAIAGGHVGDKGGCGGQQSTIG